jgi:prophage tail gpP-like protein
MPQKPDLDELRIVNLDTGQEFTSWESASITSEFLTPCDSFRLEAGADIKAAELARDLFPGAIVQILVNGHPQLTGYVDKVSISDGRSGGRVHVEGRDFLSSVVDGNVDPRMQVAKTITVEQLCAKVITEQFAHRVEIVDVNRSHGTAIGKNLGGKRKSYQSKHPRKDPLKDITPRDNEGAFSYLSRILTHHGYWLWGACDATHVVVAGPEYNQPAAFKLIKKYDPGGTGAGRANNVLDSTFTIDETSVPTLVQVRGQAGGAGSKSAILGAAKNFLTTRFKPVYISDRDATSKEKAERVARVFLARQMRNFLTYECTVAGFSDRETGGIYQVDSIADVDDERCGVQGPMWIESRSFEKSRGSGTTTRLKLIPRGTLVLDWQPDEQIPQVTTPLEAQTDLGKLAFVKTGRFLVDELQFLKPTT